MQRPDTFTLNMSHYLARGLRFGWFGATANATTMVDSGVWGINGKVYNNPVFTKSGGTWECAFDTATEDHIDFGREVALADYTVACWCDVYATTFYDVLFGMGTTDNKAGSLMRIDTSDNSLSSRFVGTSTKLSTANAVTDGSRYHIAVSRRSNALTAYSNGVDVTSGTPSNSNTAYWQYINQTVNTGIAERWGTYALSDIVVYDRALMPLEIAQLADPSNVMLSGLLNYPRRKWWPVSSGGAVFKPYWAANATQVAV